MQPKQKEPLFDTFFSEKDYRADFACKIQRQYNFTCHDEYSDKLILHSTSTVNCQRRVQWHVCIKCKIREFGQWIHAFDCVYSIPLSETYFESYVQNPRQMRSAKNGRFFVL